MSIGIGNFLGSFLDRFVMACQGYLDSNYSPRLVVQYFSNGVITMNGVNPYIGYKKYLLDIKHIFKELKCLIELLKIHLPGDGYHFGGTFPIIQNSVSLKLYSDELGRPMGLNRVHIVDASVLPFIPAGPFTSLSLANTFRISEKLRQEVAIEQL